MFPRGQAPPALQALIAEKHTQLCLLGGDITAAHASCRQIQALPQGNPLTSLATQITTARLLRARQRNAEAAALLSSTASTALALGHIARAAEALTEAAASSDAAGQTSAATACLDQALSIAADETITAPFTAHTAAVRPLLLCMDTHSTPSPADLVTGT